MASRDTRELSYGTCPTSDGWEIPVHLIACILDKCAPPFPLLAPQLVFRSRFRPGPFPTLPRIVCPRRICLTIAPRYERSVTNRLCYLPSCSSRSRLS
jgi:hypothetical protein